MAKLIHILAASVGTGLVLGASIRLGEAIGSPARKPGKRGLQPVPRHSAGSADRSLSDRLERLEKRVMQTEAVPASPEWQAVVADVVARMDRQQGEVEAIQHQVKSATRALNSSGGLSENLRDDLHRQLSEDLDRRLSEVEEKLHRSLKAANKDTVSAMVASIETRVAPRISQLENDITGQSAALAELRDCSEQSERSIQRLLTVLERVMSADSPRLAVVTGRDEAGATARRPASFK